MMNFIWNIAWAGLELVTAGVLAVDFVVREFVMMLSNGIALFF